MEQGLETGVAAEGIEVGIVLQPLFVTETIAYCSLEQVERSICFAEMSVGAGGVVEDGGFLGVDGEGARSPVESAFAIAEEQRSAAAEIKCTGIAGFVLDMPLDHLHCLLGWPGGLRPYGPGRGEQFSSWMID